MGPRALPEPVATAPPGMQEGEATPLLPSEEAASPVPVGVRSVIPLRTSTTASAAAAQGTSAATTSCATTCTVGGRTLFPAAAMDNGEPRTTAAGVATGTLGSTRSVQDAGARAARRAPRERPAEPTPRKTQGPTLSDQTSSRRATRATETLIATASGQTIGSRCPLAPASAAVRPGSSAWVSWQRRYGPAAPARHQVARGAWMLLPPVIRPLLPLHAH
jgi:hypothetical protein